MEILCRIIVKYNAVYMRACLDLDLDFGEKLTKEREKRCKLVEQNILLCLPCISAASFLFL